MTRRVGILGGTFDPIHIGHIAVANEAVAALKLDTVLIVPAGSPWQKNGAVHAAPEDRYAMALVATLPHEHLDVSRVEIDRDGPSYTVETLRTLAADPNNIDTEFFFITGADALAGLPTWREYPALLGLATFVGVTRPGHNLDAELPSREGKIKFLPIPGIDVSSTMIRRRLAAGQSIDGLAPADVITYIRKRNLYSEGTR